jgi:hypothetical protein
VTVLQILSGAAVAEEMNDMDVGEEMGMCID